MNVAPRSPRTSISVCSGVGGLDLGLTAACGVEPVVYIEREAFAAACLVARMAETRLAPGPVWDDVCTFDARPWRGLVDLVAGGTPCQDLSVAGKRVGLDGSRSRLFFEHVRIAVECEAPFFFWENVAGAVSAVPRVCDYLSERCYTRGAWTVVRASDVDAPHQRARVFFLAHSESFGQREPHNYECAKSRERPRGDLGGSELRLGQGESVANGHSARERQPSGALSHVGGRTSDGCHCVQLNEHLADGVGQRLEVRGRESGDAEQEQQTAQRGRNGLGPFPPGRADIAGWARVLAVQPHLAPALPQPRLRGVAHGLAAGVDRAERLRACGNGVVPAQAAHAWRGLWAHLFG